MSRRKSRRAVIQILYRDEFHSESFKKIDKKASDFFLKSLSKEDTRFAVKLLQNIQSCKKEIDHIINEHIRHWKPERVSLVDLNIMRLAVFEILFCPDIPDRSSLNEALELARQFGEKNSVSFVNGVLDQVLKAKPAALTKIKKNNTLKTNV